MGRMRKFRRSCAKRLWFLYDRINVPTVKKGILGLIEKIDLAAFELQAKKDFFEKNKERAERMLATLADERSRIVWKMAVDFRSRLKPLKKAYCDDVQEQYFLPELIHIEEGEVFIDGGAFIGDTIKAFLKLAHEEKISYGKIVAFEPSEINLKELTKNLGGLEADKERVHIVRKGLSDREDTLLFKDGAGSSSIVVKDEAEATSKIPVIDIDSVPECRDATWIKMDIEGSEMAALRGARQTILRNKPKLTICIYHSDEDMLRIPEYVHELLPKHKLYIRHHSPWKDWAETVLYAVP